MKESNLNRVKRIASLLKVYGNDPVLSYLSDELDEVVAEEAPVGPLTKEEVEEARRNKINAIKMVRTRTGCSLYEAKSLVEDQMKKMGLMDIPF